MPLQNRVTPRGDLITTPARGMFMGNRGRLHDGDKRIVRHANSIFLDEAVGLSAGHRPCAECRRPAYRAYLAAVGGTGAPELNTRLRDSRRSPRPTTDVADLPDGVFVESDSGPRMKWLGALRLWTPEGYVDPVPVTGVTRVITPEMSITALRNGFQPAVHPSAEV
jgi:hypothetical protein